MDRKANHPTATTDSSTVHGSWPPNMPNCRTSAAPVLRSRPTSQLPCPEGIGPGGGTCCELKCLRLGNHSHQSSTTNISFDFGFISLVFGQPQSCCHDHCHHKSQPLSLRVIPSSYNLALKNSRQAQTWARCVNDPALLVGCLRRLLHG